MWFVVVFIFTVLVVSDIISVTIIEEELFFTIVTSQVQVQVRMVEIMKMPTSLC